MRGLRAPWTGLLGFAFIATATADPPIVKLSAQELLQKASASHVSFALAKAGGRQALELRPLPQGPATDGDSFARLSGVDFHDGEIEADLEGAALPGSDASIRAFVGLGFRADDNAYEAFYLRMLNGRSSDQLQRNHSAQYMSYPDFGWKRLRTETPGVYESYVDLAASRWTHVRLVVCGAEAALYVDRASHPALIVHDLKRGAEAHGGLLLWVGPGTLAHFSEVSVRRAERCSIKINEGQNP